MPGKRSRYQVNAGAPMAEDEQDGGQKEKQGVLRQLLAMWRTWVIIGVPILLLPIPLCYTDRVSFDTCYNVMYLYSGLCDHCGPLSRSQRSASHALKPYAYVHTRACMIE